MAAASRCLSGMCSDLDSKTRCRWGFCPLGAGQSLLAKSWIFLTPRLDNLKWVPQPHLLHGPSEKPVWLLGRVVPGLAQRARASRRVRGCGATGWNVVCLNLEMEGSCLLSTAPCLQGTLF